MKKTKRLTALLLVWLLLVTLCACAPAQKEKPSALRAEENPAAEASLPQQSETLPENPDAGSEEAAQSAFAPVQARPMLCGGGYYQRRARTPVKYADMDVPEITREQFEQALQAIRDAAESGSGAAFHSAVFEAEQAMTWIETAYAFASNENAADPMDDAAAKRMQELESFCNETFNLYYGVLHEVSLGENASMLRRQFDYDVIAYIEEFDLEQAEQVREQTEKSTELLLQYEQMICEDKPDYDAIAELYVELVEIWKKEAELAGYESCAKYMYDQYYLRDYSPTDAQKIWDTAKHDFSPLLFEAISQVLDAADRAGERFAYDGSDTAVLQALAYGAAGLSPEIRDACAYLTEYGLYDIAYSEDKLDQGYTIWLSAYEVPFIFNCPYGDYYDFCTMFHEFGHFVSAFYGDTQSVSDACDLDLSELQSQGMEVMFFQFYDEIFGEENAAAIRAETLINLIDSVVEGALYDEFQQKVFEEEDLTAARVKELYLQTCQDYGISAYEGLENGWMDVIHNFEAPFYYISYAVSAMPALELFVRQEEDPAEALDSYLRLSAMSPASYYMTDALKETGLANHMTVPCGDVLADRIRQTGALDVE